jgi:hypothetical protein
MWMMCLETHDILPLKKMPNVVEKPLFDLIPQNYPLDLTLIIHYLLIQRGFIPFQLQNFQPEQNFYESRHTGFR